MTVLYVDTEHDRVLRDATLGPRHQRKIEKIRACLAAVAGVPCLARRFSEIDPVAVERLAPGTMVIGGNTTDWAAFETATLAGLLAVIRVAPVPILGICAGHQLIGFAHGARWGPLGALQEGEGDPDPRFAPGQRKERGFLPVEIDGSCLLFHGLEATPTFFQSHSWQLEDTPPEFVSRASSRWSPIQAIERRDRPVFGVQFHPERSDDAHPDGATVLRNFFGLTGKRGVLTRRGPVTG